jgi:hypothetical protein
MKPEKREVVDLRRYRQDKAKAVRAAKAQAQEAARGAEQPILGSRPGAAVIVVLLIAVFVVAWLAPKLF